MESIQDAMQEYLAAVKEMSRGQEFREIDIAVQICQNCQWSITWMQFALLKNAEFRITRRGKHNVMSDGGRFLTIPRHNHAKAFTMRHSQGCLSYGRSVSRLALKSHAY